jgi:hypothetical protein
MEGGTARGVLAVLIERLLKTITTDTRVIGREPPVRELIGPSPRMGRHGEEPFVETSGPWSRGYLSMAHEVAPNISRSCFIGKRSPFNVAGVRKRNV